jgi:lambda family phage minor tail protein L
MPHKILPDVARDTVEEIVKEAHSLEPSAIIALYEIDISEIKKNLHLGATLNIPEDYLRFHNEEAIGQRSIYFKGETYHPMPIIANGFELSSSGELPRPKLTFVSLKGVKENEAEAGDFAALKNAVLLLENMIGARVTRIRTFAKYLDAENNIPGDGQFTGTNPEFPREIYFVERKVSENKTSIQLELSSVLDLENFKLPGRVVLANRCPWTYRGEGCCYEYNSNNVPSSCPECPQGNDDKNAQQNLFGPTAILPKYAPPIATDADELITGFYPNAPYNPQDAHLRMSGEWSATTSYPTGSIVYVEKSDIRYYYVSKGNPDNEPPSAILNVPPPNGKYWISDRCSKTIQGCKLRWGKNGKAQDDGTNGRVPSNDLLMFGGFPGTNSKTTVQ